MAKKKFFYDSLEDSTRRIGSSVVMARRDEKADPEPCWVNQVQGLNTDQHAQVLFLPYPVNPRAEDLKVLPLTPDYFEVRRLPQLGYVDYGEYSFYLSRSPIRNGKQGFCRNNLKIPAAGGTVRVPDFNALISRKEFSNVLMNRYDNFRRVFDKILKSEEPLKRAFSRTMALSIDDMESVSLWIRGIRIGISNNPKKHGPVFKLPQKFRYLSEELEENGIKVE